MKRINRKTAALSVGVLAVLVLAGGAGKIFLDRAQAAGTDPASSAHDFSSTSEDMPVPAASFPVPQPLSPEDAERADALLTGEQAGEPTVMEDENGDVTIIPDWEAKAANSHPVTGEASANVGGSGGGSMDLKDGVYQGDHPKETSPAKPPETKPEEPQTPSTPDQPQTPAEPSDTDSSTGGPPSRDGTHNGEISADEKYIWITGFGWINNVGPGEAIPGKGTHTEVGGEVVGEM